GGSEEKVRVRKAIDVLDLPGQHLTSERVEANPCRLSRLDPVEGGLGNLDVHPHGAVDVVDIDDDLPRAHGGPQGGLRRKVEQWEAVGIDDDSIARGIELATLDLLLELVLFLPRYSGLPWRCTQTGMLEPAEDVLGRDALKHFSQRLIELGLRPRLCPT